MAKTHAGPLRRRRPAARADSDSAASTSSASAPEGSASPASASSAELPDRLVLKRQLSQRADADEPPSSSDGHSDSSSHHHHHHHHFDKYTYAVDAPGSKLDQLELSEVPFLSRIASDQGTCRLPPREPIPRTHKRLVLTVGILLGAAVMFFFGSNGMMDKQMQNALLVVQDQLGIDLKNISFAFSQNDLTDVGDRLFSARRDWWKNNDFSTGRKMYEQGYRAHFPVVLVPGIISTGLESWSTGEQEQSNFRKRLWGTSTMMRTIVFDKEGWINQIKLDENTGLDPPGIRVRAAQGLDAADYFITGYWIWSKILENLASIGYDTNSLHLAGYDWRLSMHNLEERDRFFSRLKRHIEGNKQDTGLKTVLVSHSMGSTVMLYFFKWVEASGPTFGNGGPNWVEDHIESLVSIAGTWLGVPKAMAALFTGEMRDTVELPPPAAYLLEKFFSREERVRLFRGWAGSSCMLLKGGAAVWGGSEGAPDDPAPNTIPNSTALGGGEWHAENVSQAPASPSKESFGMLYNFRATPPLSPEDRESLGPYAEERNISAQDSLGFLLSHAPGWYQRAVYYNYTNGIEYDPEKIAWNGQNDPRTWTNPLEVALPHAPSMKLVNLYGEGKPTERAYWIEHGPFENSHSDDLNNYVDLEAQCENCPSTPGQTTETLTPNVTDTPPDHGRTGTEKFPTARAAWIDSTVQTLGTGEGLGTRAGCRMGEGDGTVSLLSLGAMGVQGWKRKRYNPAGVKIIVHETKHEPDTLDLRGGTTTGDHVDILGSWSVNENVLKVASGHVDRIADHTSSRIHEYAQKVYWDEPPPDQVKGRLATAA